MTTTLLNISVEKITKSKINDVDFENLAFGSNFSDHMFMADYDGKEWTNLKIMPFGNLTFTPALLTLHYGQTIFEGMKAFRNQKDEIVLFRPLENWQRLNRSAERMCMPKLPEEIFMAGLGQLLELDQKWVPGKNGASLYIRPFMFATDEVVGMRPSTSYKFIIFSCPVNAYYNKPLKVKIETRFARSVKGGIGGAKTAANYAASLYPTQLANQEGYDQLIWTDGKENKYIEEAGTMNIFLKINGTILTSPTEDTVLEGITRKSVIQIAQEMGYAFEERKIEVKEVMKAIENNTLEEAFGAGTAAVVTPIETIGYEGTDYALPALGSESFAYKVKKELSDISLGKIADIHNWMYKVC
jgi:branched-chain amino acid aminotransferase